MRFNKIVDVTESDSSLVQTYGERETNDMLQYDDSDLHDNDYGLDDDNDALLEHDLAIIHPESAQIMDDWKCAEIKVDEISSDPRAEEDEPHYDLSPEDSDSSMDSFFKPEADQNIQLLSDDAIAAMRRQNNDYTTITRVDDEWRNLWHCVPYL